MTENQLVCFLALARHGSMGRAAAATGMAPPSLAQAITALEHEAGGALVRRVHSGTVLTSAGMVFLPHARRLLRLLADAAQPGAELAGAVDVAADPVLAVDPGARLIGAFRHGHPRVQLRVTVPEQGGEVLARLLDGRAELALTYLPVPAGVTVTVLGRHELMAVFPPGTEDVPEPVPVAHLDGWDAIDVPGSSWRDDIVGRVLALAGAGLRVAVETPHREAVLPLVLQGAGMAFLPETTAAWAAAEGAVVRTLDPPLRNTYALATAPGELTPPAAALREQVLAGRDL